MTKKRLRKEIGQIKRLEVEAQALYLLDKRDEKAERQKKRKADNRQKFWLGGLVKEVGLAKLSQHNLRSLLIWLKEAHDELGGKVLALWRPVEIEIDEEVDNDPVRVLTVAFKSKPSDEAKQPIKSREWTYDGAARVWTVEARERELRTELEKAGADKYGFVLKRAQGAGVA